ncbi:Dihydrofolate synthase/folylpolyglutamate synthase [Candidatus Magnetaquicoccaceae bacterium FCR-1]|uniref:Dihydrofolate synthase/folylpolyglutamate synthase n=1 Tax=Candidatus Magnetaquiglobus chichijimensis TaxID=3141448 RepID=A0ABQ0C7B4_9PROT
MDGESPVLRQLLERRPSETIRPGLTAIRRLLARLGDPHRHLAVIHVAGTNGKGSVIAFLEAMLRAAGIPVARFTSPHLHRFNERIRLDGRAIDDRELDPLLLETLAADPDAETTFFELTTAAAFLHVARQARFRNGSGIVLLETGLGGRLDATNVVTPLLSIVTAIGLDHCDYLGPSLERIAFEKAGILKRGIPAVVDTAGRATTRVVAGIARRRGVPLAIGGRDFRRRIFADGLGRAGWWRLEDRDGAVMLPRPALAGRHQVANAALAVAGLRCLRREGILGVSDAAIRSGVGSACWPGRLERFPGSPPVWLDGAHNPDGARVLRRFLRSPESAGGGGPTVLLFSVLDNKDGQTMVRLLAPLADAVVVVPMGGPRGRSASELLGLWPDDGRVVACDDTGQALERARAMAGAEGRVVVTGSLLLVGEARSLLC